MAKPFLIGLLVAAQALAAPVPTKNIVQVASGIPDLSTLVTALKAGNLTTALSGQGPFTVFAPTNEAFAALPKATLAHLLDPKNVKELDDVLEYHVIAGAAVRAEDLEEFQELKTLEGQYVDVIKRDGSVLVYNSKVITADVGATNGIVHVIDRVLIPRMNHEKKDVVEVMAGIPALSMFVSAINTISKFPGGSIDLFKILTPFTFFAPTNEAFAALPKATLAHLLDPKNTSDLSALINYHVANQPPIRIADLEEFQKVKTLEGQSVGISKRDGSVLVENAKVITADLDARNGVVHVIDRVLVPPRNPPGKNIFELIISNPDLSTFVAILKKAAFRVTEALKNNNAPSNLFVPTNAAFAALPKAKLAALLNPTFVELDSFLGYLTVSGPAIHLLTDDSKDFQKLQTEGGLFLSIIERDGSHFVDNSIIKSTQDASNGALHVIDRVLESYDRVPAGPPPT